MGRRQTFTRSEIAAAAAVVTADGVSITLRRGDLIMVVAPAPVNVGSGDTADSALEAWLGGRNEGAA
jgi:hypothetical protein